ncbi:MAG: DAK2 domain-containing protein [Candidatus Velthaea sp.]
MSAVTSLDGRGFEKFVAAGTYFLRKYRGVLNDLNVFPVPDGDTGSNMYLTAKAALCEAHKVCDRPLHVVAAAAAAGSLLGARGNSGVILSQMLRGFAHNVRHRDHIDTFELAVAMKDAVAAARAALTKPVEGTILSVASAAAEEAYRLALHEPDFYRLTNAVLRAANEALDRTPEQLPQLKEAGVVDSGGAGFVYFLEGVLRFLPDATIRTTAFPRRPVRSAVFTRKQSVGEHRFCTEFIIEDATLDAHPLRDLLAPKGESLIVVGAAPTIKVHIHTGDPDGVKAVAGKHGTLTRLKVENMEEQHNVLIDAPPHKAFSVAAVVPGPGYEAIARELGADVTIPTPGGANPSVRDLLVGVNATLTDVVFLLPNDANVALAAREVAALTKKTVIVVPTRDIVQGLAVLLELGALEEAPPLGMLEARASAVRSGSVFFAGKQTSVGGVAVKKGAPAAASADGILTASSLGEVLVALVRALGADDGGLVTLYYGGAQKERDAQRYAAEIGERIADVSVEYYYGGQTGLEYWVSCER